MHPYKTFSCHKIGSSHIAKGLECEDYSLSYEDEYISVCSISDGHGDKNCFRSAKGARLACETAVEQIKTFFSYKDETKKILTESPDITLNQLEKSIIAEWTKRVESDVSKNPFEDKELSTLNEDIRQFYKNNTRPQKAYGCTLIISAITDYCWFVLQIGDGVCTAIFEDGVYFNPVPNDNEGCVGNRSTSICSSDSIRSFRHYYSTVLPVAVFVTSDGIEESFSEKDLNKCYYTVSYWVNTENTDSVNNHLSELLPQISSGGSNDDVGLSFIINPSYPAMQAKQSIEEINHKVNVCVEHTKNIKEKYNKALKSRNILIAENDAIERRISELQSEIEIMKRKFSENSEKLQKFSETEQEYESSALQLDKMLSFRKSAIAFWENKNELLSLGIDKSEFINNTEKED